MPLLAICKLRLALDSIRFCLVAWRSDHRICFASPIKTPLSPGLPHFQSGFCSILRGPYPELHCSWPLKISENPIFHEIRLSSCKYCDVSHNFNELDLWKNTQPRREEIFERTHPASKWRILKRSFIAVTGCCVRPSSKSSRYITSKTEALGHRGIEKLLLHSELLVLARTTAHDLLTARQRIRSYANIQKAYTFISCSMHFQI